MFGENVDDPGRVRIKICGITNPADAQAAIECGADALGFNFFPGSSRYIDISSRPEWMWDLPSNIDKAAVLVNPNGRQALAMAELPMIDALQLHGRESPEFCQTLVEHEVVFMKALGVRDENSLRDVPSYFTRLILLDSLSPRGFGGSGEKLPWNLARTFVETHPNLRVILAGGLTPENVAEAIREVRPFGVDVASGVESSPGRKDLGRLRAFVDAVQTA